MGKNILVTGGSGNIGTHTLLQLLLGGYKVDVVDLDNFSDIALEGVRELAGDHGANLSLHKLDLCDGQRTLDALGTLFSSTKFDYVLHFARLKAVGESVQSYRHNSSLKGTINLLRVMAAHGCKKLVFSSSATVYGVGLDRKKNPPGIVKHFIENTCREKYKTDSYWKVIVLRY